MEAGIVIPKNTVRRGDVNIANPIMDMKKSLSRWMTRSFLLSAESFSLKWKVS